MTLCTLTDMYSWLACAKLQVPFFGELLVMTVFLIFYQLLRGYPSFGDKAMTGASVIAVLLALALLGINAINPISVLALVIILALLIATNLLS